MMLRSRIWPWVLVPAFTAAAIAAVQCHVWSTQDATPNNRRSKMVNRHYDVPSPEPWLSEFDASRERALKGNAESELYLGVFYANGNLVGQDYREAAEWFSLSAEHGNPAAMRNLALLYDCGIGVGRDYALAAKWYKEAARRLEPAAFMGLARFPLTFSESVLPVDAGSIELFRLMAFLLLGVEYSDPGMDGLFWDRYHASMRFRLDDSRLADRVRESAERGDGEAQLRLAIFYRQGQGVPMSAEKFVFWLQKAADSGSSRALFMLNKEDYYGNRITFPMFSPLFSLADFNKMIFSSEEDNAWLDKETARLKCLEKASISGEEPFFRFWYNLERHRYASMSTDPDSKGKPYLRSSTFITSTRAKLIVARIASEIDSGSATHFLNRIVEMAREGYPLAIRFLIWKHVKFGVLSEVSDSDWRQMIGNATAAGERYSAIMRVYFLLADGDPERIAVEAPSLLGSIAAHPDISGLPWLGQLLAGKAGALPPIGAAGVRHLEAIADKGDVNAMLALGQYFQAMENRDAAIVWLEKAADSSGLAMCLLANAQVMMKLEPPSGLDIEEWMRFLERPLMLRDKAAELGCLPAALSRHGARIFGKERRYILDHPIPIESFGMLRDCAVRKRLLFYLWDVMRHYFGDGPPFIAGGYGPDMVIEPMGG